MFSDTMMLGGGRKAAYPMENSLLFRGGQYFTRTPSVAGDRKTFTIDFWMRLNGDSPPQRTVCVAYLSPINNFSVAFDVSGHFYVTADSVGSISLGTTRVFHDVGWANFRVEVDTSHATASERVRFYYNGVRVPFDQASPYNTFPAQNYDCQWNAAGVIHYLGVWPGNMSYNTTGYVAEFIAVDGAGSVSRGETDPVTGSWRPKAPVVSAYGPNGFCLGKPWNSASLGSDYSGQGNSWTPSGFAASDVVVDTPTNVYATLNSLIPMGSNAFSYSEGNLRCAFTASGVPPRQVVSTLDFDIATTAGYTEVMLNGFAVAGYCGICDSAQVNVNAAEILSGGVAYVSNGTKYVEGSNSAYGSSWGALSILGIAWKNGSVWFRLNGAWQNGGDPVAGTGAAAAGLTGRKAIIYDAGGSGSSYDLSINFGQKPFASPPPTGFKTLCTANLPVTTGQASGSFTGNAIADGPCIYTGAVPVTLTINGNAVVWGTHADKLATGFKIRTASSSYNASGTNNWTATYNKQPTVGSNHTPANAQIN